MSALKYKDRIRIERPGAAVDADYGTKLPSSWIPVVEVWAEIVDVMPSKSEAVNNGLRLAANSARVRIRYRPEITSVMRIVELSGTKRTLQIVAGPAVITGRTELEFMVEEFSS